MKNNLYQEFIVPFKHSFRVMRNAFLALFLFVGTTYATESYSQNMRVTVVSSGISTAQVLSEIEEQTDYLFVYDVNEVNLDRRVNVDAENRPVSEVLDEVFEGTDVDYAMEGKNIMLMKRSKKEAPASAQQTSENTIQGVVTDANGEPIIGANIMIEGTTTGTITDFDGRFTLDVPENATLQISYIGFVSQNVKVNGRKDITVKLVEDAQALDEVVVVGYGVMKKRDITGSISSLKAKDITSVPASNVLESMQGRIAGLDMTKSDGEAGASLSFTLRGNRSLNASNAPLIMVDGVAYGTTLDINPSDIESIEVLKDASSTAIYGSRGANGVILITTKRGATGKTNVSFNAYFGPQMAAGVADIMNAEEYANFKREAYRTQGITDDNLIFTAKELEGLKNREFVDFQDLCLHTGFVQNYEVSVTGGTEKTKINMSLGYYKEEGLFKNDDLTRFNGMMGIDQTITNRLKVGASMLITYKDNNKRQDPLNQANKIIPIGKVYNDDGTLNMFPSYGSSTSVSPLADEEENAYKNNTLTKRFFGSAYLNWEIVDDLMLRSTLGVDLNSARNGYFYDKNTINGGAKESKSGAEMVSNNNYTWETTLNWNKTFGKHNFNILLGNSVISNHAETFDMSGKNQTYSGNLFWNLSSATDQREIGSDLVEDRMLSFFGRVHYKLYEKYLFNFSLRADGSSVLAKGHKWGYFPSAAFAWRMIDENFMKGARSFMSDFKLRFSWGISGNSAISPYQTLGGLGSTTYAFGDTGAYGFYPRNISNKDLGWEKTQTFNFGIDFGFFNNRINGNIEIYQTNTTDLLMSRQLPPTSGFQSVMENVGEMRNRGVEVVVNTVNFKPATKGGFSWDTSLSFTLNRESIQSLTSGATRDLVNYWFVGSPVNVFYDYNKIGIWQLDEEAEAAKYGQKPGDIKVEDINHDGVISPDDDRKIVGTERPDFVLGMNNYFSYKNFDLSVFMYARVGQTIESEASGNYKIDGLENGPVVDYWTPDHPTNSHPRPDMNKNQSSAYMSTLWYQDGSFLKIRDVTLGYTFPDKWMHKIKVSKFRLYATLKNFFTFSHMSPYDPERGGSLSFPMTKQVVFGVNLNF